MKKIYVFSGLGADQRVFKSINFGQHEIHFVHWIDSFTNESIEEYSKRLLNQIKDNKPTLIGLSFGGIMTVEVSKHIETEKIILIASAKTKKEIPFYFRLIRFIPIHKVIPISFLKKSNFITNWFFGVENKEDQILLKKILGDTDSAFLKWAIDKIVNWKNVELPKNAVHIHGSSDNILPIQFVTYDFKINGGGHLMTLTHAEEISRTIKFVLDK
jgi:pimeloyl-ACP methyl ester carboxylesterase